MTNVSLNKISEREWEEGGGGIEQNYYPYFILMRIFSLGFWKVGYVLTTKVQEVWFFTSLSHIKKISHSFWHKVHSNNSFWIRHLQLLVITLKFCKDLRIIRIKLLITWPEFAKNNMILRICILLTYVCYVCYAV